MTTPPDPSHGHDPPPAQRADPVPLDYRPPLRVRGLARRLWWAILLLALALLVFSLLLFNPALEVYEWLGLGIAGTPAAPLDFSQPSGFAFSITSADTLTYTLYAMLYLGLFLLTQWLFLMPRGSLRLKLNTDGQPMLRSAIAAAFVAMLLSAGLMAIILDWPGARSPEEDATPWLTLTSPNPSDRLSYPTLPLFWLIMLALWIIWAIIFNIYSRSLDRHTAVTGLFRALIAGTILELLVAAPAHAWVARREDCYCARGSWTGLVFGATALFWLFGPGVFFLFLREKRRRERLM